MTDNTRPAPGAAAPRGATQGEQKRPAGEGRKAGSTRSRRRSRRRRGSGAKAKANTNHNANQQGDQQPAAQHQGTSKHKQGNKQGNKQKTKQHAKRSGTQKHNQQRRRRGKAPAGRAKSKRSNQQRRKLQYQDRYASPMDTRDETSAGGLVVSGMAEAVAPNGDVDLGQIYAALIGRLDRRGRLLWSMPKGHVEHGEHQWKTAEREVWEETGILGEAFDTLGTIDYWFVSDGVRIHKTVHHNLLRYVDGEFNDEDPEVTEVTWVPLSELIERLAYADERKLARIAVDRMPALARKEAKAGRATPR